MLRFRIFFLTLLAAMFFLYHARGVVAAEYSFKNGLANQLRYDSNILFSRLNEVEDWIYEIIPRFGLERRDELSSMRLMAKFRGQLFFKENELNTLDQDYSIDIVRRLTERFSFTFNAYYIIDTTTDREILETGTLLTRNNRTHYSVAPTLKWSLKKRDTLSISVPFLWTNYDGGRYVDYRTQYLTASYVHVFRDNRTSVVVQPQFAHLKFHNSETDMYDFMVGINRQETERLEWSVLAGVNYSESTFDTYGFRKLAENVYLLEKNRDTSYNLKWVAMANVGWEYENGKVKARFLRTVSESGYGEAVTRMRLTTRIDHRWTERLTLYLGGQYSSVEDQSKYKNVDYVLYEINPGLIYRLSEHVRVGAYYRYLMEDNKRLDDTYDRHIFCVKCDVVDLASLF